MADAKQFEQVLRDPLLLEWIWREAVLPMGFVGRDGLWVRVNPALCKLLGYTEDELRARTWEAVSDPRDASADHAEVEKVLAGKTPRYSMIKRYIPKYGDPVCVRATVIPWKSEGEQVAFMFHQIEPMDTPIQRVELVNPTSQEDDLANLARIAYRHWRALAVLGIFLFGSEFADRIAQVVSVVAKLSLP